MKFTAAKATFEQASYGAAAAIDDKADTGWAINGGTGKPQSITFEVAPDMVLTAGSPLVVTLDQQFADGKHAIGKFKLTVLQEPAPAAKPVEPAKPTEPANPSAAKPDPAKK